MPRASCRLPLRAGYSRDDVQVTNVIEGDPGLYEVMVRTADGDRSAWLDVRRHGRAWSVKLDLDGSIWEGEGTNLFAALRDLRVALDDVNVTIGINGARPNAAVSGMLADMGEGRQVYLLTIPRTPARPETAPTLAPAPLDAVAGVVAQDAFKERWFA